MGIPRIIRPCAFCFVQEDDRVLIGRFRDPDDGSYFYRPLGGGIEFGETGEEAARRELREELGVELGSVGFLGFLENLFEMGGEPYHELCLILTAEPAGWSIDRFDGFEIPESVGAGSEEIAIVRKTNAIAESFPLYPDGVTELVRQR